jgi:hypothetical protein
MREGTTATHLAEPRISSGMPLSGVAMISFKTVAADSTLPAAVSENDTLVTRSANSTTRNVNFIIPSKMILSVESWEQVRRC